MQGKQIQAPRVYYLKLPVPLSLRELRAKAENYLVYDWLIHPFTSRMRTDALKKIICSTGRRLTTDAEWTIDLGLNAALSSGPATIPKLYKCMEESLPQQKLTTGSTVYQTVHRASTLNLRSETLQKPLRSFVATVKRRAENNFNGRTTVKCWPTTSRLTISNLYGILSFDSWIVPHIKDISSHNVKVCGRWDGRPLHPKSGQ